MIELQAGQFHKASALFSKTHYGVLAAGTLAGCHPGRVFLDNLADPRSGLVCTRLDYFFLAGQPSEAILDWLYVRFQNEFIPQMQAVIGTGDVILFFDPFDWNGPLFERFADCQPLLIHKKRHILPAGAGAKLLGWQERVPPGYRLLPYTLGLMEALPELVPQAELFFGSVESFLAKGYGWAIMDGNQLASTCSAVFVGSGEVEIDIHTAEAYRGRGLAFLAASAFIEDSLKRGLNPIWGCWPENLPSNRLASKLGFSEDALQPACLMEGRKES